jgi:hypothetical protein
MAGDQTNGTPPSDGDKLWVVCCVCNKVLQVGNIPGDTRTSHGLCTDCSGKTLGGDAAGGRM